jgi:hypothetical protein
VSVSAGKREWVVTAEELAVELSRDDGNEWRVEHGAMYEYVRCGDCGRAVPVLRAAVAGRPARIELEKGRIVDWICRSCLLGDER